MNIKVIHKDKLIGDLHLPRVPERGEIVRMFSYNASDYSQVNIREFMVFNVITVVRDQAPPEGFRSSNIGTEHFIVMVRSAEDINKSLEEEADQTKPAQR